MEAREFSTSKSYSAGDMVIYGGVLYRFISAHSAGTWDESETEKVDSNAEQTLSRILAGMDNAEKATEYAGTVIFDISQIEGTRYKYIFTNAQDPRQ